MMINSVILILREVLEAALIISVLLALSQKLQLSKSWLIGGLLFGATGAIIYAMNIQAVSSAFEGIGQEVLNASIHIALSIGIALFVLAIRNHQHNPALILVIMASCVTFAITREGSEIIIYLRGLIGIPELIYPVISGSMIGAGIGMSMGVFFYYLIVNLSLGRGLKVSLLLLIFIAGGMILQATQLLLQADLIISQQAIWDSSSLLSERSLVGQLLYALIGYEATPTPIQVYAYMGSLFIMIFLSVRTLKTFNRRESA